MYATRVDRTRPCAKSFFVFQIWIADTDEKQICAVYRASGFFCVRVVLCF